MNTGQVISGIGHGLLIGWALFGGLFLRSRDVPAPAVSEVTVISEEEFAAMTMSDIPPEAITETAFLPEPVPDAAPDSKPAEEEKPKPPEAPVAEAAPETEAAPEPEPPPEPLPRPVQIDPETPESPEPPAPDPGAQVAALPDAKPTPRPAPRVAPEAAPERPPEAEVAPEAVPEVAPSDEPADVVEEERPPAAPEEATTEIVTEAEKPSAAPVESIRPKSRPKERPVQVAAPKPDAKPDPKPAAQPKPEEPRSDAVDDALAEALGEAGQGTAETKPDIPSGPPLTSGEKGEFALAVKQCWVVDPGSESARIVVDIGFEMTPDGKVVGSSLKMIRATEGSAAAINSAFEAGRRAILRCGARGYNLPADKYAQWREVEISFNPENMRIR